ncbi:MAG: GHKL domain-containing protein [Proteobacteria bacterium]|nr:GHKL domain-containing protein [Pseudomonadota bacterium]MBU1709894.1 GHKL domain-containing protein [Pseudomonadota bacterium]
MRKLLYPFLVVIVVGIGLLHFFTPGHHMFFHDTYRRLSYFPIVIGAIWFGVRGGLSLAVLSSIAFIPHLLLYMGGESLTYLSELTEIVLYLAAGLVTGMIAGRAAALREKYRLLSEKLEGSYARLHEETQLLLEVEEQLGASQKLSALGEMAASLAHEIKNPLSSIKGTAEIFIDEFPEGHPKREFAEILLKEVSRLNTTVEGVLQYSRQHKRAEEETEALSGVMNQVTKLLAGQVRKKSVSITVRGLEQCMDFPVAGAKMSQVFLNIILNAIDAVPRGGRVGIEISKEEKGVSVTVSDNGPGVPEHLREKIFEPFVSEKEDGTGLGLSISRKIVEGYGGTIALSAQDGGASFRVFLPG